MRGFCEGVEHKTVVLEELFVVFVKEILEGLGTGLGWGIQVRLLSLWGLEIEVLVLLVMKAMWSSFFQS